MKTFRSSAKVHASLRRIYSKYSAQNDKSEKSEPACFHMCAICVKIFIARVCFFSIYQCEQYRAHGTVYTKRDTKRALSACSRKLSHYWNISFDIDSINKRWGTRLRQWIRERLFRAFVDKFSCGRPVCIEKAMRFRRLHLEIVYFFSAQVSGSYERKISSLRSQVLSSLYKSRIFSKNIAFVGEIVVYTKIVIGKEIIYKRRNLFFYNKIIYNF